MKIQLSNFFVAQLIVWNVGQGQWVTEVSSDRCIHYDLGGEIDVTSRVFPLCRLRPNLLYLSHWDLDHISFASRFAAKIHSACLVKIPPGKASTGKRSRIESIPLCQDPSLFKNFIYSPVAPPMTKEKSNELSQVVFSPTAQVLLPGDSTSSQEKKWKYFLDPLKIRGLVLGHHGSRTSTSEMLLEALPRIRWAVASARESRYGHPHRQIIERLQRRRIPLLKTEDWGHIHFELQK